MTPAIWLGAWPVRALSEARARSASLLLVVAFAVGANLRLGPALRADFPLNDGGLFLAMIREVQRGHYVLPTTVHYNALDIPFAYPPLGFYLGAAIADVTSTDPLQILRLLPAILSVLTMGAFALLARTLLPTSLSTAIATFAFVVMTGSYVWEVMGGGLTRALGMLFALLALREAYVFYTTHSRRSWLLMVLLGAATALSHLDWALFLAVSVLVAFLANGRDRAGLVGSLAAGAAVVLLTAPWWALVLAHHGLVPFQAAGQTGSWVTSPSQSGQGSTAELFAVAAIAAAASAAMVTIRDPRFAFLGWCGLISVVDLRAYAQLLTIPAMLALGYAVGGLIDALLPPAGRGAEPLLPSSSPVASRRRGPARMVADLLCVLAIVWCIYMNIVFMGAARRVLEPPLSVEERQAMAWAATTPESSRFLVLSTAGWALDREGEWFPVLAGRESVATVQGTEWIPGAYQRRLELLDTAQECGGEGASCLERWISDNGETISYVYLASGDLGCCGTLRRALRADPGYAVVYDGPGATIFQRMGS